LRPFTTAESSIFFGRAAQIETMLLKLQDHRFLAVVGASGSGKSSLVRAGLLPALEAGMLDARENWQIVITNPGSSPIANLANSLEGTSTPDPKRSAQIEAELRRGPHGLLSVLRRRAQDSGPILILVDQFEELFRYRRRSQGGAKRNESAAFVNLLLDVTKQERMPVFVVVTMRSDFLGDCNAFYGLPEAMNESQFLTPRLTPDQIREAITGPLKQFRANWEPQFLDRVVNDMVADVDQLPLMEHCLMRCWWRAQRRSTSETESLTLTLSDYEFVGGIDQALSNHADEVYLELKRENDDDLSKDEDENYLQLKRDKAKERERIAKHLFRSLCVPGADKRYTRWPVSVAEIAAKCDCEENDVREVVKVFANGSKQSDEPRHFIFEHPTEQLLDISHEAIMWQWSTLKEWLQEQPESSQSRLPLNRDEDSIEEKENSQSQTTKSKLPFTDPVKDRIHLYRGLTPASIFLLGDLSNFETNHTSEVIQRVILSGEANLMQNSHGEIGIDLNIPCRVFNIPPPPGGTSVENQSEFDLEVIASLVRSCEIPFIVLILSPVPGGSTESSQERISNRHLAETLGRIRNSCQRSEEDEPHVLVLNPNWDRQFWEKEQGLAYPGGTGDFFELYTAERTIENPLRRHYFALRVLFELQRALFTANQPIPAGKDANGKEVSVKIFISHANRDGIPLASALRSQFHDMAWLERFYDFEVLKPGQTDWQDVLKYAGHESLLLVLRTNAFDQRPWCLQTVMWAEKYARPIVIIDARSSGTQLSSTFPYNASNAVVVPGDDTLRVLTVCMRELLRSSLASHMAPNKTDATVFLPRTPTLTSLYTAMNLIEEKGSSKPPVIVYAGPPLEDGVRRAAQELLRSLRPDSSLFTLAEYRAASAIDGLPVAETRPNSTLVTPPPTEPGSEPS
tara:strand:+ start:7690 stop:10425 length:2736 start_codon:yes stop_codon:yes gene_type:complete